MQRAVSGGGGCVILSSMLQWGKTFGRLATAPLLLALGACATVRETTLDNGLRVIVQPDRRAPVAVAQIWYKVGSVDEPAGSTGISHVLEHMMFKGTSRRGPNEFSRLIAAQGGRENAFTSRDYTAYFQQLEKSRLPVSFELEAERMHDLRLDGGEFAKEVRVVMEERRLRTDDRPQALLAERFTAEAWRVHPYRQPVIGWMQDLEAMRIEDLRAWYRRFYVPNNAVLVVVGDVEPDEVLALARRHYGPIPRGPEVAREIAAEQPQRGLRRLRVAAPAEVPSLLLGFHVPSLSVSREPWEPYALEVLAAVLDGGASARLARELVREQRLANGIGIDYSPIARAGTMLLASATPTRGTDPETLERAILEQFARLRSELVSPAEIERVKAQVVASNVYQRDSMFYQAMQIGTLATSGLDWRLLDRYVENVRAVTVEQVREVARRYLIEDNLTVAVLDPLPLTGRRPPPSGPEINHVR